MNLSTLSDKQLKSLHAKLGGKGGNYKRETLIARIGVLQAEKPAVPPSNSILETPPASKEMGVGGEKAPLPIRDMPPIVQKISVLPAEPLPVSSQALTKTLGMITPSTIQPRLVGGLSEQQILEATESHRQRGMTVKFADGCWEFRRGERMDTGNMAMPLNAAVKAADLVMQASISAARVLKNAQQS